MFMWFEPNEVFRLSIDLIRFAAATFSVSIEFLKDLLPRNSSPEFFELLVDPKRNRVI